MVNKINKKDDWDEELEKILIETIVVSDGSGFYYSGTINALQNFIRKLLEEKPNDTAWEYKELYWSPEDEPTKFWSQRDEAGEAGWELVAVAVNYEGKEGHFFKRRLK